MAGLFITFEGIEGCGKTTQANLLREALLERGYSVVFTREPGGTPIGDRIRDIVLNPDFGGMSPVAELFLYQAARAQHVTEKIRPALASGAIVLCDRFTDSTLAYQGGGRRMSHLDLAEFQYLVTGGLAPDLTILLDLPVDVGLARATRGARPDRIEHEPPSFHERIRSAFLELASSNPERIRVMDGQQPAEEIAKAVWSLTETLLNERADLTRT